MRTTVTLDSDVEQILRERMAAKGVSFKEALNEAVRASATPRADYFFESPSRPMGAFKVDLTKANELAGMLEDEEILAKMRSGR